MRIFLIVLFSLVSGCSYSGMPRDPNDPDDNLVEYQFIDADTMKPIQGAYVNVVWVSPTPPGKVNGSECLQAVLLRSDANGWVKMDGPKGSIREVPWIMVPDYELFQYAYGVPDKDHVRHVVRAENYQLDRYPAWTQTLKDAGYEYFADFKHPYLGFYKAYPINGFADNTTRKPTPQRYFFKGRSLPGEEELTNVGNACGPGGVNIGLSEAQRAETNTRRGIQQLRQVCDERWDATKGGYPQGVSISQALWLVEAPMENNRAWTKMLQIIPNYDAARIMTKDERVAFCAWMQPFKEKYQ